jgi:hypothetical protein
MRLAGLLAAAAVFASGCDVVEKIQNRTIMVATVLKSPELSAGEGGPLLPSGVVSVASAQVFFGERGADLDAPPAPLTAESARLEWSNGSVVLASAGQGVYAVVGGFPTDQALTFRIRFQGEDFTGTVTVPAAASLSGEGGDFATIPFVTKSYTQFAVAPFGTSTQSSYTISRTGADTAFWELRSIAPNGSISQEPVGGCTNVPQTGQQLLSFVLDPAPFKAATFTIPKATCFPNPPFQGGTGALVALYTVRAGSVSDNLFLGSGAFAGASDAGVIAFTP